MSRLALLVGAVPQRCSEGPVVRLLPGLWTLHVEGQIDSALSLYVDGRCQDIIFNQKPLQMFNIGDVQLKFMSRGTEKFINVFAEKP